MGSNAEELKKLQEELKWVTIREDYGSFSDKTRSKFLSNPFVPIGCLVTAGVLSSGIYSLMKKDPIRQQKMMRYRVLSQGLTLVAIVLGYYIYDKD